MILRRVIEHVKAQNWTAVALDFVIVVTGVFIGLQVSNWNDALSDQRRVHEYLQRIYADLDADIEKVESKNLFWKEVAAYGEQGLTYAETGAVDGLSNWDILLAFFQASQVSEYVLTRTTYEEMQSAGDLSLIGDIELREVISRYYTNAVQRAVSEYPAYREHVRGVIPTSVQSYIWTNCYESDPENEQKLIACDSPIEDAHAGKIIKAIGEDAELMSELRYWISTMQVASLITDNLREEATNIQHLIDETRGVSKPRSSAASSNT